MSEYTFVMDESESFARVIYDGSYVAKISNCNVTGCLTSSQDSQHHRAHELDHDSMWDEFYMWADGMVGKGIVEAE